MSKTPTPKADQLRTLREAQFADSKPMRSPVGALRENIDKIPKTKPRKAKRRSIKAPA